MPVVPPYSYRVFWSPEDKEFVATCVEVPGLSGLAPTEAGAIDELKIAPIRKLITPQRAQRITEEERVGDTRL